jgi:hypothetical protein
MQSENLECHVTSFQTLSKKGFFFFLLPSSTTLELFCYNYMDNP